MHWYGTYTVGKRGDASVNGSQDLIMVTIDELPYGCWTSSWKKRLYVKNFVSPPHPYTVAPRESAAAKRLRFVRDARIYETDATVKALVLCEASIVESFLSSNPGPQRLQADPGAARDPRQAHAAARAAAPRYPLLEDALGLCTKMSMQNMHVFDHDQRLRRVRRLHEFFVSHYALRHEVYVRRMDYIRRECAWELARCSNKYRFVCMIIDGSLALVRKSVADIDGELRALHFTSDQELGALQPKSNAPGHRNAAGKLMSRPDEHDGEAEEAAQGGAQEAAQEASAAPFTFTYLRRMHMDSVSEDLLRKLRKEQEDAQQKLDQINATTVQALWLSELQQLEQALDQAEREKHQEYYAQAQSAMAGAAEKKRRR